MPSPERTGKQCKTYTRDTGASPIGAAQYTNRIGRVAAHVQPGWTQPGWTQPDWTQPGWCNGRVTHYYIAGAAITTDSPFPATPVPPQHR